MAIAASTPARPAIEFKPPHHLYKRRPPIGLLLPPSPPTRLLPTHATSLCLDPAPFPADSAPSLPRTVPQITHSTSRTRRTVAEAMETMEERIRRRQEEPRGVTDPAVSSGDDESTDGEGEFEFPCFLGGDHGSPALADDLFADGRIRPATFYPVFGRRPAGDVAAGLAAPEAPAPAPERRTRGQLGRLFLEESRAWNSSTSSSASSTSTSSSSAAADELEGAAPETYCVWAPGAASSSPRPPRPSKSGSTGSMARWRRVSDLVVGRSHSDGKEKFLFLPANPPTPVKKSPATKPSTTAPGAKKKAAPVGTEINTVGAAQGMAQYGAAAKTVGPGAGAPRRTFLPYREGLVGFFANVHGISRRHPHPY